MEHAKKMILIPESTFLRMKNQTDSNANPGREKQMATVHNDMERVVEETGLQAGDQLKLYNQVLQRYRNLTDPKSSASVKASENSQTPQPVTDGIYEQILSSTPKQYGKKMAQLLNFVKKHPEVIRWDRTGRLIYNGEIVPVIDLFGDVMVKRKNYEPNGLQLFLKGLREINTPTSYIGNTTRRQTIDRSNISQQTLGIDSPTVSPKRRRKRLEKDVFYVSPRHNEKKRNWLYY
jgi:hypothetical protein